MAPDVMILVVEYAKITFGSECRDKATRVSFIDRVIPIGEKYLPCKKYDGNTAD
jgi:hypothetical protein